MKTSQTAHKGAGGETEVEKQTPQQPPLMIHSECEG